MIRNRKIIVASSALLVWLIIAMANNESACAESSDVDIHKAIQQTAYSYYMRGPNLQYSSRKANNSAFYSPEEATCQNMNYLTCSAFVKSVYYDYIGVKIPPFTESLLDYGEANIGKPEVVMYGETVGDQKVMHVYDDSSVAGYKTVIDMSTDELIQYLAVGDILTYTGHTMMVYDLAYNADGKISDVLILEGSGDGKRVQTKISGKTSIGDQISFGYGNHAAYLSRRDSTPSVRSEGSVHLASIRSVSVWKDFAASNKERYSVLRFVAERSGKPILTYHGTDYAEKDYDGVEIELPRKTIDRLKFEHLFIEKTVNVFPNSSVETGDLLTYTILVKNESSEDYLDEITVHENISRNLYFQSFSISKEVAFEIKNRELSWNIGKLSSGEEVIIRYTVKVKDGCYGESIISTGTVESIPSAVITNPIRQGLTEEISDKIETEFDRLNEQYSGKQLINEIYKRAMGINLGLDSFDVRDLIINSKPDSVSASSIFLNPENLFSRAVLNQYWNSMYECSYEYNGMTVYSYDLKQWKPYTDESRIMDTIYEENFRTGDILIYTNHDDVTYQYDAASDTIIVTNVTNEDGEYAYIFVEGRGFIGVNHGGDGKIGTADDRNEFSYSYYEENGISVYSDENETEEDVLKFANYQTLFGKDYYVILRPAQILPSGV